MIVGLLTPLQTPSADECPLIDGDVESARRIGRSTMHASRVELQHQRSITSNGDQPAGTGGQRLLEDVRYRLLERQSSIAHQRGHVSRDRR